MWGPSCLNVTFLVLCRDSFLGPTCFLLFTWSSDTHVGLRDLDLGGFICRFVCSPTGWGGVNLAPCASVSFAVEFKRKDWTLTGRGKCWSPLWGRASKDFDVFCKQWDLLALGICTESNHYLFDTITTMFTITTMLLVKLFAKSYQNWLLNKCATWGLILHTFEVPYLEQ